MTTKGGLQRRQHRQTLFAQRGQIAANACKGLSESFAAEAARDFLLDLDHPKISLGQIIVKIYPKILKASSERLSAVSASDRADCERHVVCSDPVCQGEPLPEGEPDLLHQADGEIALPTPRLLADPDRVFPPGGPVLWPLSYPAAGF